MKRRLLAVDPGERRTGLAGTDPTHTICVPLPTLTHAGMAELPGLLEAVIRERDPEVLVVGLPLLQDGSVGTRARKVLALIEALKARYPGLEVTTVDESLSTRVAHEKLKEAGMKAARRRRKADAGAALEILERYLRER
ncbi:MAG: Holliday junction resolvase RuvX [Planctomycetota bacterium]